MSKQKLPSSYADMTVKMWRSFAFIEPSEFDTVSDYEREVLFSLFSELGVDYLEFDTDELKDFSWIFTRKIRQTQPPKKIDEFSFMDLKDCTLGDFIDLEKKYNKGVKGWFDCVALLLRREKLDEWQNKVVEPRNFKSVERHYLVDKLKVSELIGKVNEIGQFINNTTSSYKPIFEQNDDEQQENEDEQPSEADKLKLAFKWERFLFYACDGDLMKIQELLKLNVFYVFNFLSMQQLLKIYPNNYSWQNVSK